MNDYIIGEREIERGEKMTKILNLTQHAATEQQTKEGVIEPKPADKEKIRKLLTFDEVPSKKELVHRAIKLAEIAARYNVKQAMVGGAPYLMPPLEIALLSYGIEPVYSFTRREVVEMTNEDGTVKKTAIFAHVGWVRPEQDFFKTGGAI